MNDYSRGSEWRRWDLHVHTAGTLKNDQFAGETSDAKWDNYIKAVNEYEPNIAVVGVTDYLSIDNYIKFKTLAESNIITKQFDLILPNVELRILPVAVSGSPVNIHCIFNPALADQINDRFFAKLKVDYSGDSFSASKNELIRLGKKHQQDQNTDDEVAYKKGLEQFVLPFGHLKEVFEKDKELRRNTFIVVSNKDHDGASGVTKHSDFFTNQDESQLDSTRWDIYQFSDAIFSSNEADRLYFCGNGTDDEDTLKHKCGGLMPCIHGCDAHSNDKLFEPDGKRYCWIKSDPTFEGLRQTKFEPIERVRISELEPDVKSDYLVIDKVKFIDESFDPTDILLNPNLTTIIGGKSTGKSILLRSIAASIDNSEVNKRLKEVGLPDYEKQITGFEVVWSDGQVNKINEPHDGKKIIYIPQSYLNRLIDKKEDITSIDEIIKSVLLQDPVINNEFKKIEDFERSSQLDIAKQIEDLFFAKDDQIKQTDKIKSIGDFKGINEVIQKTEDEISSLREKAGISQDESEKFKDLSKQISDSKDKLRTLQNDLEIFELFKEKTPKFLFENDGFSASAESKIKTVIDKIDLVSSDLWKKEIAKIIKISNSDKVEEEKIYSKLAKEIKPLRVKIDKLSAIKEKTAYLDKEKEKLLIISEEIKKLKDIETKISEIINNLKNIQSSYFDFYNQSKAIILKQNIIKDDLSFDIKIIFKKDHFQRHFVEETCNLKTLNNFKEVILSDFNYKSNSDYSSDIEKIINGVLEDQIILKNNYSKKEVLIKLLQNWFIFDFQVIHSGDGIASMSSGKKSFVILKLLVQLDQSKCPILLDQPEDDLDNRSIYSELVKFIKDKKKERQIIIVTHNPNLVVGADSEEVVVANQDGNETKNSNYKFEYISGSLENSFSMEGIDEILLKRGIQQHVCEILEGGQTAFEQRENRYGSINQ